MASQDERHAPGTGSLYLLALLCCAGLLWLSRLPAPSQVALVAASPQPACPVVVERSGQGALCLSQAEAAARGLASGDVCPPAEKRPGTPAPRRMAATRLLLAGGKIDLNRATLEDLVALPEIGEGLARAILAERARGPFVCEADLLRLAMVRGLGEKRLGRLRRFFALGQDCANPGGRVK